ncbi:MULTISPECIES: AAA family ATPase [unclassified Nostoc]|uniref:trifunctional serine/threonine-protein kinase/ATP-binding protein/sensor histidine kinase n=1 Tax=unclassified Nostoc TaxID=2593658 RepID=UPI002AD2A937|nr:AAA family ATPase [Nostoc sp. DedQUE03]MDZ7971058.1 AAA family ATPase [Nostoc sp. DedQUE03]MDZ8046533.1 AAA family ATPase [Nostoc sp. DedQUE02]
MVSTLVSIPRYRISEELYNGSRTVVYRGYRESDLLPVVIKLLKNPYPSFNELLSFRNQYTIAKNLNSPLIVQTYSLQAYQNGYALIMEDFGGISLKDYFTSKQTRYIVSSEEFLEIAIALCNTLDVLYRARIIHKDIKPANILINPETKQVKLIDFSIASLLARETQTLINPNVLEGTLAYISPEQTGRMNRGIDYRTDFYSLGVTFYQLLTKQLPFESNDPMEWVHSHIAKLPPNMNKLHRPSTLYSEQGEGSDQVYFAIPQVLCDIVMKMMAKNPEDRYQSALGLKHDLEKCLEQIKETGKIETFEIAQRDICDRFLIPDKLYGRETEVKTLLEAFDRVSNGTTEMMLIAGFSGIGKTVVVNEVHKPIVKQRGYFIKGKYDQFNRNIPFSAFVQSFRDLMGQLLTESDAQIQQWKSKILDSLGENGQVIIEVIPELERIIGQQLPAIQLSGSAIQNRFNLLFQKFVQVFTTKEHPLVIFLDDLQWADSASLKLMQLLTSESSRGYLLLIGAYRDNEVSAAHPLTLTLEEVIKNQATINTITLAPLSNYNLNQLVADTLSYSLEFAQPLTQIVYQKTNGNPFFSTQFLKALYEDKLIKFDWKCGNWQCDITEVKALAVTDNVVEFIALQLQKLPTSTQSVLKLAACIGNQFDLVSLTIVSQLSEIETATYLWKALQEGLILPTSEIYKFYIERLTNDIEQDSLIVNYKFLHDRVQQAAYSLIPEEQKQATHLKIGQLLLQKTSLNDREEKLFDIVNHLNVGKSLITQPSLRHELAQLNLAAGRKARAATAYSAAIAYFTTGIELLPSDRWQHQYQLCLALYEGATEAAYLSTDFEQMEQLAATVLTYSHSWLDRVTTYQAKIQACIAQNQHLEALRLAREVLNQLGVYLPEQPTQVEIKQGLERTQTLLGKRSIESLLELPEMTAPKQKAAMAIISNIMSVAYQVAPNLLPLLTYIQVNLSVQYGNTTESTYGYVQYGLMLVAILKDIDAGYRFGQLGINLLQSIDASKLAAKTIFGFNSSLRHWREPAKDTLNGYLQAYASGLETGDIEYVALSLMCYSYTAYFSGQELSALKQRMDEYRKVIQKFRQNGYFRIQSIYYQAVLNLLEPTAEPDRLYSKDYDEDEMIQLHLQANQLIALCQLYFNKLLLSYLFHRYEQAVLNARLTEQYLGTAVGLMHVPLFSFYDALLQLAIYSTATHTEQAVILDKVSVHQEKLQEWASHAPSNQTHRWALVAAERCRVIGEKAEATDLYDRAIALAKENDYIQEEALANELAAKFYLDWGKQRIAQEYITQAYYGYARWGAKAKVADLERRYPQLLAPILQQTRSLFSTNETIFPLESVTSTSTSSASSSSSSVSVALDLAAILKAYQTLSGEIELEKLLKALLHIVIENAGADKCVLMLLESDRLLIQALGKLSESGVQNVDFYPMLLNPQRVEDSVDVPVGLINTVKRSLEPAVIVDATIHPQLINDPYIQQQQPKSILCSPILHQGKLLGILYLENNLATGAFTSDRVQLLNLLCAQAAISLENARLYQRSLENAQQLERSLDELSAAQCSLQASQQRLQLLVQQTPLAVIEWDTNFQVIDWNPAAERIFGYTKQEALGCQFQFIIPQTIQAEMERVSIDIISQEGGNYSINENVTKDGKIIICAWYNNPLVNADGELIGVASLADDITEQQAALRDRKVAEVQLQQKAQELETALQNLQQAQLQIVQSEKMSALGNLVAGVAHEMNNPLGFIAASLKLAKPTITDITQHLKLYQESFPNKSDQIEDHAEEIDLDYSLEDLPKMIDSMSMACDRLKNISTSLRTFSRADQDYKVPFNIHQGIDSTILILKHRLKANEQRPAIEVVTNYGNLPQVECFPGQLNQVFMNILANAIDALEESNQGRSFEEIKANYNCIKITTLVENNFVKIAIADNGKGMSEQVKSKIFDHLFTTKAVGKGTGLGLAIARQIILEKHGGAIKVNSKLGEGTEFVIQLPLLA